ncbi:hypothetical protein [Salarchaeum japonicum]|uniref:Uncharacterized protein n=1 Tax=Salarchaeum japonicum TaxID=555573 RepID=A0AAV3T1N1_9EURY|nr:hypothetical protein [Salarchaeum japonicum]
MATVDDDVLVEAASLGGNLGAVGLVALLERAHEADAPGVSRAVVDAYVSELGDSMDADALRSEVGERLTNSPRWVTEGALYEVANGRVSRFPREWHDELDAGSGLVAFVRVLGADRDGEGVPLELLVAAAATLGGRGEAETRDAVESLTADGVLARADESVRVAESS